MLDGLLQTKLFIPATRATLIPRPHLIERLNEGQAGKLTLISAPAGYGKTSLVTSWITQLKAETAVYWLSLDEDDSEPRQFFSYVAAALRPLIGEHASLVQLIQSPQSVTAKQLMTALINDVTAVDVPFCLILDDYHAIESLEIEQAVAFLLDKMPALMTLIITSRSDPRFPLSRLRVRGDLAEIRVNALRFSAAEAADFLHKSMNLTLSSEQVAALEARTEGWIAGLQMAALSLQGHADTAGFIDTFTGSHRFVLDYLVEEVLRSQPESVQQFLRQTAVLDRVCGPLCDAVTQGENGKEMLEQLERANMFVIPLDDERQWYRYHHLFADVMRARLLEEPPAQALQLHVRASVWYEGQGLSADAIRHALAANDFERAARLIELVWREMDITFQHNLWLSWVQQLPETLVQARPILSAGIAWAHLNRGELAASEAYLQAAERWLAVTDGVDKGTPMVVADEGELQRLPGSIASARTFQAQAMGDVPGTVRHAKEALALLPEDDYLGRAIPNTLLALAYWASGELEAAYQAFATGLAGFEKTGNFMAAISGTFAMADIKIAQGRLDAAQQVYERAVQLVRAQGMLDLRGMEVLCLGLSELHYERGEADVAAEYWQKGTTLGEQSVEIVYQYRYRVALAQRKIEQGAFDEALTLLEQAAPFWAQIYIPDFRPLEAHKVRVWLKQGQLEAALAWGAERKLSPDMPLSYLAEFEHLTWARVLIAQYQRSPEPRFIDPALQLLTRLCEAATVGGRMGSVLEILLLQVLAHEVAGAETSALISFKKALALAAPQRYIRPFLAEGAPVAALLKRVQHEGGEQQAYVQKLLLAFGEMPTSSLAPAMSPLLDPLSERELEVLRLLTTELSGPAIAKQLMVSLNTLRTHTKNIYSKLSVNSRRTAVRRAQELNLL